MNRTLTTWTAAAAVLACGSSLRAHHSVTMFDLAAPIWVKGTVVRYEPINPHAMFSLEERTSDGQVQSAPKALVDEIGSKMTERCG